MMKVNAYFYVVWKVTKDFDSSVGSGEEKEWEDWMASRMCHIEALTMAEEGHWGNMGKLVGQVNAGRG